MSRLLDMAAAAVHQRAWTRGLERSTTGGEGNLRDVHDAGDGHAGCTDDLGLEGDVELAHLGVARNGAVGRTGKDLTEL